MAQTSNITDEEERLPVAVWLFNPETGVVNKVVHKATRDRCLKDGHRLLPDPQEQPEAYAIVLASLRGEPLHTPTADDIELEQAAENAEILALRERNQQAAAWVKKDTPAAPASAQTAARKR